eukprot:4305275-Prymnesium_polylepis.1
MEASVPAWAGEDGPVQTGEPAEGVVDVASLTALGLGSLLELRRAFVDGTGVPCRQISMSELGAALKELWPELTEEGLWE